MIRLHQGRDAQTPETLPGGRQHLEVGHDCGQSHAAQLPRQRGHQSRFGILPAGSRPALRSGSPGIGAAHATGGAPRPRRDHSARARVADSGPETVSQDAPGARGRLGGADVLTPPWRPLAFPVAGSRTCHSPHFAAAAGEPARSLPGGDSPVFLSARGTVQRNLLLQQSLAFRA